MGWALTSTRGRKRRSKEWDGHSAVCVAEVSIQNLAYAGANNLLWVFPKDIKEAADVVEHKADKQLISKYDDTKVAN